jgi:beta-lactamase regulating signal transducer with metallopeptidase domain
MWVWLDRAGPILLDATVSTAIFLTVVVLAILVCRQPSQRLLIARVALLASLAMIPLVALVPLPRVDLLDALIKSDLLPTSLLVDLEQTTRPASVSYSQDLEANWLFANGLDDRLFLTGRWLPRSLTLIDLAFVGTGVAWLLLGFWGVRWLIRHSREPSAPTVESYNRLFAEGVKGRSRPCLRVTSRVQRPVVVGLFHPTILIPPGFDEPGGDPELLRLSLLHEIAHAEQWDPWFGTVASLAQTVWVFLPQIWWLRSQLLIDQEFMADRSAALRYGTSSGYAASLLALAETRPVLAADPRPGGLGATWAAAGKCEVRSPLSQRVLMLLYCPFQVEARAPRSWSWTLRIMLVFSSIVAACLCIRWPDTGALEHRLKHRAAQASPPFRVTDFTAEPLVLSKGGPALSYVMPVALPPRFELTVEVLSSLADLGKVRIAGHPLGDARTPTEVSIPDGSSSTHLEAWHQVRLKRDGNRVSLWVDGRTIPVNSSPQATTVWLTFEPGPERPAQFRNLVVEW